MEEIKYGIIVCEKCFTIPEITILNKNTVEVKCQQCNDITKKDFSYFINKYCKNIEEENLSDMPKCNYNKSHQLNSILYCFQCEKYLCEECINIHNISFEDKKHIFIKQRINNGFYCNKNDHNKFLKYQYCTLCKDYLCSQCKCKHSNKYIYNFEQNKYKGKIKEIIDNVEKLKTIIDNEELELNIFLEDIENKIKALKQIFNNYKERNMKSITFYKLLINNYEHYNNIYNYNIINNIIINSNFDFSVSKFLEDENNSNKNECFISKYNKLYSFYNNKFHFKTKDYSHYFITKHFCKKEKIKKCIFVNEKLIAFIFSNDNYIYFIDKENNNKIIKKEIKCKYIKDIYPFDSGKLIFIDEEDTLRLYNINEDKDTCIITKYNEQTFNFIIPDKMNENKFFMIHDNKDYSAIYYYINDKKIHLIFKDNKLFDIKTLFNEIITIISENKIDSDEENKLKNLFLNNSTKKLINIYEYLSTIYNKDKKIQDSVEIYKELLKLCEFTGNIEDQRDIDEIDNNFFLKEYGIEKMTEGLIKIDEDLLKILENVLKELS